jgi:hypothetical protein
MDGAMPFALFRDAYISSFHPKPELHQEVNEEASLELTQAYDITKQWKVSPLISCLSSLE